MVSLSGEWRPCPLMRRLYQRHFLPLSPCHHSTGNEEDPLAEKLQDDKEPLPFSEDEDLIETYDIQHLAIYGLSNSGNTPFVKNHWEDIHRLPIHLLIVGQEISWED